MINTKVGIDVWIDPLTIKNRQMGLVLMEHRADEADRKSDTETALRMW